LDFRSPAGVLCWLAAAGILALFTLALTGIAIAGLSAKSVEGAGGIAYPVHLLALISSAFVHTQTMPGPGCAFADN
jgi:ABC-2 type transport system permease protein